MHLMDCPTLPNGQHAVLEVDVCTGSVLRQDRQWHTGSDKVWRVFESLEAARAFATAEVEAHPSVECVIHDGQARQVQTVRNEQHVACGNTAGDCPEQA